MDFAEKRGDGRARQGPCRRLLKALGERYGKKLGAASLLLALGAGAEGCCGYEYRLGLCLSGKHTVTLETNGYAILGDVRLALKATSAAGPSATVAIETTGKRTCSFNDQPPPESQIELARREIAQGQGAVMGIENREYTVRTDMVKPPKLDVSGRVLEEGAAKLTAEVACKEGNAGVAK